jgi:lipopolysaccharide biosynthesis regulator YciM
MGKGSGKGGAALISISYNYDALEEFVSSVKIRFKEQEERIIALEKAQTTLAGKNAVLERTLQQREEEIRVLRGEVKQMVQQAVEVEEQNHALREENALAFTKIYKKLESSATSEGLQKEMMSLKEGTDNRMLVLENLMREVGGDKMKTLMGKNPKSPCAIAYRVESYTRH